MSLISHLLSRLSPPLVHLTRIAITRLSIPGTILAVTAATALFFLLRPRPPPPPPPSTNQRRRRRTNRTQDLPSAPHWLSRVRRVTLGAKWADNVRCDLFEKTENGVVVRQELHESLKRLTTLFEVYIIVQVEDDKGEENVRQALQPFIASNALDERKVVFCETEIGKVSVVREIESELHVDESLVVIRELSRFVPFVVLCSLNADKITISSAGSSNVAKYKTLDGLFARQ